ncbi:Asp23/Gls24 family envelope stress response protein [Herbiconiux sp. CPCC 205716]|uniref:Asp23/Gls24 family envelope stress response protein n=1 Tax=Herbiconiux gentiana TaxID=2970912 RepID=A0ABT2GLS2_9MICO|nr:Asp23/Gls24 family envelope stress response protein [Herbiconiux gentiana]MCS5715711.1 Asp23/Gls24 family envelope stress response protein [Herbiconiux gentiana]
MNPDHSAPDPELDGHTLAELGEYLDRGRTPYDPSIENSPGCRLALANLTRLAGLSGGLLTRQAEREPDRDALWIAGLLEIIRAEIASGRDVPVAHPDPALRLTLTEAAVRGLVRQAGDTLGGVVMGRCVLDGDVGEPGAVIRLDLSCAVAYGLPIAPTVDWLRERVRAELARHTELVIGAIDVAVDDVYPRGGAADV